MATNVLILRGNQVCDWDIRPLELIEDRFSLRVLVPDKNWFDTGKINLPQTRVRTRFSLLPGRGMHTRFAGDLPANRMVGVDKWFEWADVVHVAEIANWYSAQAALAKRRHGFKLVVSTWETIPSRETFRSRSKAHNRAAVLEHADLFIPWTERARDCLILEGVAPERVVVTRAGVDTKAFRDAASTVPTPDETTIISPGRLVWGKGHNDVLRAVAALRNGVVAMPEGVPLPRVTFLGSGRERNVIERYADDLGVTDHVEFREHVPYEQMPHEFARASMMVLASLPNKEWEEQFGFVLVEAMAAGLPIAASTSGAIPEVVDGAGRFFSPGDWIGMAQIFAEAHDLRTDDAMATARENQVRLYSLEAAAERYAAMYERVTGGAR